VTRGPNPFAEAREASAVDEGLARAVLAGDNAALDELVRRHQAWIYNLALRVLWNRQDAEDATQEILLRIVTHLSSFRAESAFGTWAYRIAVNHLLDRKRSKAEQVVTGFECYGRVLDETPDAEQAPSPEEALLVEEAKVGCMTGMLLCLDRSQRLVFTLGEIFDVNDVVGARLLDTTRDNYRQLLSRARRQLQGFLQGKCGLASSANPCRCARKTRGFVRAGIVDPARLQFAGPHLARVAEVATARARALEELTADGPGPLFRDHPFQAPPDFAARLGALVRGQAFRALLDLD